MADHLTKDVAGILSFVSPVVSRSNEACGEWEAGPPGLPWGEAREEMVKHTCGYSRRDLLLIDHLWYA